MCVATLVEALVTKDSCPGAHSVADGLRAGLMIYREARGGGEFNREDKDTGRSSTVAA